MSFRPVACPYCKDSAIRNLIFKVALGLECFKCNKLFSAAIIVKDGMWHTEVTKK